MKRRTFLQSVAGLSAIAGFAPASRNLLLHTTPTRSQPTHVAVVGAGAFGGWTALHLLRKGARVTLIDAWGPGNARASSGGETRVIRYAYTTPIYVELVARSLPLWDELGAKIGHPLLHRTGVLFMAPEGVFVGEAHETMKAAGAPHDVLNATEIARRFPEINPEGMHWATYEEDTGYVLARQGCAAVLETFLQEGGAYRTAHVRPGTIRGGELSQLELSDGTTLSADRYVFACGPWLGTLFPDVIGGLVEPTRQEIFYFGTPAGDTRFSDEHFPVWADMGAPVWYGIPGNEGRGFKVADDSRGPAFDPTYGERTPSADGLQAARDYMEFRFPALRGAPLVEARVCQYEQTPDGHFIIDRHPDAENVWFAGGGSGHGYKLGPALGEHIAERVLDEKPTEQLFGLARFDTR